MSVADPGAPAAVTVAVEGEAPIELEAPVEGAEAAPIEGEAAAEPAAEAEKPAPVEIPEEVLQRAALKFANKTMAAARRAESAVAAVRTENATLKESLKTHTDFVAELQSNPFAAIRKLGFKSIRAFMDHGIQAGGEQPEPTADDRVSQLERLIKERDAKDEQAKAQMAVDASRKAVFAELEKHPDRFDFAATAPGKARVWDEIVAYSQKHGQCPDAACYAIADAVEKAMESEFSPVRKFRQAPGAKTGQSAAASATAARTSGKTLTNGSTSGAPTTREYSLDPDERREQVNADLRADGIL